MYSNEAERANIYLAPMAETGFSHRLTAYKIVGHFFGLSYLNISLKNQVDNRFLRISNISVHRSQIDRVQNRETFLWTVISEYIAEKSGGQ